MTPHPPRCHFFVDKACTKSAGEFEWVQDEGEEEGCAARSKRRREALLLH